MIYTCRLLHLVGVIVVKGSFQLREGGFRKENVLAVTVCSVVQAVCSFKVTGTPELQVHLLLTWVHLSNMNAHWLAFSTNSLREFRKMFLVTQLQKCQERSVHR